MGGSKKKQTIGYKYYLGLHCVLCHGPVDYLLEVKVDNRLAWAGKLPNGPFNINKPSLFGGEEKEGGIEGSLDLLAGGPSQGVNGYLASRLGSLVPAFRGVTSVVLKQVYIGVSPYLKRWAFRAKRIHTRQGGSPQWYDPRAEINGDEFVADPGAYSDIYSGNPLNTIEYGGGVWLAAGGTSTLRRSEDNGLTWQSIPGGTGNHFKDIATDGEGTWISVGGDFAAVKVSNDDGETFTLVSIPSISSGGVRPSCITKGGEGSFNTWMVGADYSGFGYVALSQTNGTTWTNIPYPDGKFTLGSSPTSIVWLGGVRWMASTVSGRIYKSANNGFDWEITPKQFVTRVVKVGNVVIAISGESNSTSRTEDEGATWTHTASIPFTPRDVGMLAGILVLVGDAGRIALSYNMGRSWDILSSVLAGGQSLLRIKSNGADTMYAVGLNGVCARIKLTSSRRGDMNPAHIIRECLTDTEWGMGYPESEVDDASFTYAADHLFNEGLGISLLWDKQIPLEKFIGEILNHIDGALFVDRGTGKFTLRLIRGDYDEELLLRLDETNIQKVDNFTRPSLGEFVNSVTVIYWNSDTGLNASVTVQDIALIHLQQSEINTTVQYPGVTSAALASRLAQRDLKTLSSPRISCVVTATREAKNLNIGDAFKLYWPEYGVEGTVMRVTGVSFGDGKDTRTAITCTQDTFDLPDTAYVVPDESEWVDPMQDPIPVAKQLVMEVPYRELIQVSGQSDIDTRLTNEPDLGFIGVSAGRPNPSSVNARLYMDAGAGYSDVSGLDFCPTSATTSAVDALQTSIPVGNWSDFEIAEVGTWAQIGEEIMYIVGLAVDSIVVKRGIMDSLPSSHAEGATLYLWDVYISSDDVEYVTGEQVFVKITPVSGTGQVDLEDAMVQGVTLSGRALRPYRPGNLMVNGEYTAEITSSTVYPLEITWVHRNRVQDTAAEPVGYYEGSMTPEAGTTYTLRVVEVNVDGTEGSVLHTESGITGEGWSMPGSVLATSTASQFKVGVSSVRDSLTSWQESSIGLFPSLTPPTGLTVQVEDY